jgi:LssY C-terminus
MLPRQNIFCRVHRIAHWYAPLVLVLFIACWANAQTTTASAPSEYSFTISGSQAWTDAGVDLAVGDSLSFTSEAKSTADCTPSTSASDQGGKLPLPSAPAGALIARTSDKGDPLAVSSELHVVAAGHLFLGINAAGRSNCALAVKLTITHGQSAASASAEQPGMKQKLTTAAQTWLKTQFGGGASSAQSESNSAVSGSNSAPETASSAEAPGLNLPTVILDAELKKNIDGIPRRVHDHLGNLGDMVNFVIVGSQEKVQTALDTADWHVADVDSKEAGLKAIMSTYQRKDYLQMPMSHLYLFDRMQDFGYEQAQAFSVVATRHHFRIWKASFTWNNETVWVGAATHDIGFEKDIRTGKLTHKIDPNVDTERDNLAQGLQKSGKTKSMTYYLPPNPVQEAKNASGGSYRSDGRLLVVFLN